MAHGEITSVVILGGGTAGWLSAAYLAATARQAGRALDITVIKAPDIAAVGVGEGTWPTMRGTLATIGIEEGEFIRACDASFKQGSRFDGWVDGSAEDSYLHPFTPPPAGDFEALLDAAQHTTQPFAAAMNAQAAVCSAQLAPRQPGMRDFEGALNYAYHFDATKFARLLSAHAIARLGVRHIADRVTGVIAAADGDIAGLATAANGVVAGALFLDCSGQAGMLIGQHFGVPWIDRSGVLFNDCALAVQVPVAPDSPIAAQTIATAHQAGWIWDIGLPQRRGIGCVYASRFCDDAAAESILLDYVARAMPGIDRAKLASRKLTFSTGYRQVLWHRNCLAIGQAAGFIEPLEASAIVMVELSLRALVENFPQRRATMDFLAKRFNALFHYRWERVVEFLKLHYLLSQRSEPYWQAQRDPAAMPQRLAELLALWRDQPPSAWDFPQVDEIFSAASHQYILYGMGFPVPPGLRSSAEASSRLAELARRTRVLTSSLPTNRAYADELRAGALRQGFA